MTGYDVASGGSVKLDGKNVNTYFRKPHLMHKLVGFCPQTNCIDPQVSVKVILVYFAKLSGIKGDQIELAVSTMIKKVGLDDF